MEHNYAAPDPIVDTALHYRLSTYRYWNIKSIRPAGFSCTAKLFYDGRKTATVNGSSYLDTFLVRFNSDSLILLYRPNTKTDWKVFPGYTKNILSTYYGYMTLDSFPDGQYTFADTGVYHITAINKVVSSAGHLKIYPNPSPGNFTVEVPPANSPQILYIYNMQGKMISHTQVAPQKNNCILNGKLLDAGAYNIFLWDGENRINSGNLIITH